MPLVTAGVEKLQLNQMLRYGLAGGMGLFCLVVTYPDTFKPMMVKDSAWRDGVVLGALAFVIGTVSYALLRALVYPVLFRVIIVILWLFRRVRGCWGFLLPWPSKTEVRWDRELYYNRQADPARFSTVEWSDQVHFLCCSSLVCFVGINVGQFVGWTADKVAYHAFFWLAMLAGIGGFVHNLRLMFHESTKVR